MEARPTGLPVCLTFPTAFLMVLGMLDRGVRMLFLMHHSGGIEYPAALICLPAIYAGMLRAQYG